MDGFNRDEASDRDAYTRFQPETWATTLHWADQYVLLDNHFASARALDPDHLFEIAGQSGGAYENPAQDNRDSRSATGSTGLPRRGDVTRSATRRSP